MRFSRRLVLALALLALMILLTYNWNGDWRDCGWNPVKAAGGAAADDGQETRLALRRCYDEAAIKIPSTRSCALVSPSTSSINTVDVYPQLDFQPDYMQRRDYWDSSLDKRYMKLRNDKSRPTLKVFLVAHSHVDPGWLKTFDEYYIQTTRNILDNMVNKLVQHRNMTFIWTEISFFARWWQTALPARRRQIKQLVKEGRLEFTSGSWVMTDEATPHFYSMLDQMIEGHQWLKQHVGVVPKSVWSVDTFGHGPVAPYLMRQSGLVNTVVQRIHYSWKRWLADRQVSDFHWQMPFQSSQGEEAVLCHNMPFDIYSTKHSCGPDPKTCLTYDFRSVHGEYNEYTLNSVPISKYNVREKAKALVQQYSKTGSLTPHNVVMVLVGDDFRFDYEIEWDQQYVNYQNLFNYINANGRVFNDTSVSFGTVSDYFDAVRQRTPTGAFPTLQGDFFPYADIFSEGRPAYWTGYFTSRPFYKILAREVESRLRGAEIAYTVALNRARRKGWIQPVRILDFDYGKLVEARRHLALFQHHDAITGTSKAFVMRDYGQKLFQALSNAIHIQAASASVLLANHPDKWRHFRLTPTLQRPSYDRMAQNLLLDLSETRMRTVVLYNSDAHFRHEFVRFKINSGEVQVLDADDQVIRHQINPVWASDQHQQKLEHVAETFQLVFIAPLPPLSISTFRIQPVRNPEAKKTLIYCSDCSSSNSSSQAFQFYPLERLDIQVENEKMKLVFDGDTGFLKSIRKKSSGQSVMCSMEFGAYPSSMFHSGAYLFMPDANAPEPNIDVLREVKPQVFIISGPVMSEISVVYDLLVHSTILFHQSGGILEDMIWMETTLDMGAPPTYREHEFFIRFKTDIRNFNTGAKQNSTTTASPEFFTDQNGFQMARRVYADSVGVEANYYPVTSSAFIQDQLQRLNLLFSSTRGLTSAKPGWIEFMVDRRTIHDDGRGMGEGMTDNLPIVTPFILILEDRSVQEIKTDTLQQSSLLSTIASSQLQYPATSYVIDPSDPVDPVADEDLSKSRVLFMNQPLPCNVHLVNLRTLSESVLPEVELPSTSALFTVHNRAYDCSIPAEIPYCNVNSKGSDRPLYSGSKWIAMDMGHVEETSLTGLISKGSTSFDSIRIPLMQLRSYNVTFA